MKIREIVSVTIIMGIIFLGLVIFSFLYANPLSKYKFKNEIQAYLNSHFSEKMILESIEYSFKESTSLNDQHFIAVVYPENKPLEKIRIDKGYDGYLRVFYYNPEYTVSINNAINKILRSPDVQEALKDKNHKLNIEELEDGRSFISVTIDEERNTLEDFQFKVYEDGLVLRWNSEARSFE